MASSLKLSPHLKALINAPHALPSAISSPGRSALYSVFDKISSKGEKYGLDHQSWLTLGTAALVTVNSPESVNGLWDYARSKGIDGVEAASVMRETGLKCISFSGIPRTINALVALRSHLPDDIKSKLSSESLRTMTLANLEAVAHGGRELWNGIYSPHHDKLLSKLADAHPDLPVHILHSHYSHLLSDPPSQSQFPAGHHKIGRVLTSIVAIACLRAQQGVAPQLTSHVFGLKKALLEGGGGEGEKGLVKGEDWLTGDQGVEWVLDSTDKISEVVAGRTSFAGPVGDRAKL